MGAGGVASVLRGSVLTHGVCSGVLRRATQALLTRAPCAPPAAHELNPLGDAYAVAGMVQEAALQ